MRHLLPKHQLLLKAEVVVEVDTRVVTREVSNSISSSIHFNIHCDRSKSLFNYMMSLHYVLQLSVIAMQAAQTTEANLPVKKAVKIVVLMEPTMDVDEVHAVEVHVSSTDIAPVLEGKRI